VKQLLVISHISPMEDPLITIILKSVTSPLLLLLTFGFFFSYSVPCRTSRVFWHVPVLPGCSAKDVNLWAASFPPQMLRSVYSRLFTVSQNHRIAGVGRELCGSSSPTPLPKQADLDQAAQDHVQVGLEYLQGKRIHSLPGQPVPVLCHPQSEEVLPLV